ncbi:Protein of unknown function [Gryllus bimaculatus]|nr:Protein of unknown function [Gryllus bimaculatus]
MRAQVLITPLLALLAAGAEARTGRIFHRPLPLHTTSPVKKCCGLFKMLSGDGRLCVKTEWPNNTNFRRDRRFPLTLLIGRKEDDWLRRWLPPGIRSKSVRRIRDRYRQYINQTGNLGIADFSTQNVSIDDDYLMRPKPGGGSRAADYCVDAAQPPMGPFALLFHTICIDEERTRKCCVNGQALVEKKGDWMCEKDEHGYWSPVNSSFTDIFDSEFPKECKITNSPCGYCRLAAPDISRHWALSSKNQHIFSTRLPCFDYRRDNGSVEERIFYCKYSSAAKGLYWLLRPLCVVSALLLMVSLVSVMCVLSLRRKPHGWCLANHAACLFAFNTGQVVYFVTMSDAIDANEKFSIPPHLQDSCRHFALWILQVSTPKRRGRRRFYVFSAFAWGSPAVLTVACLFLFTPPNRPYTQGERRWYAPSLMETRVCYKEPIVYSESVGCLVLINLICLVHILRKVRYLRRGNAILRTEEQNGDLGHSHENGIDSHAAHSDSGDSRTRQKQNGRQAVDAKTIKMNIKMLLMTGVTELISEVIMWIITSYPDEFAWAESDYHFPYRASGYITDFFRAACVAWLAAPEGGYLGPLLKTLRGDKRNNRWNS